jgi:hypothetical protein
MTTTQNYALASLEKPGEFFPNLASLEVWKRCSKLANYLKSLELMVLFKFGNPNLASKLPNYPQSPSFPWLCSASSLEGKPSLPTGESSPWGWAALHSRGEGLPPDGGGFPIILTLDLGTTLGWALRGDSGHIFSGTVCFKPRRFEGGGMRYLRFKRWLEETHRVSGGAKAVYFEEVRRHLGVDAAHVYGGFLAHLTAWCEHHEIPYQGVPVGTIKQFATGKGNAPKEAMIQAMQALGHAPADDNEADALALLHWAINRHKGDLNHA